MTGRAARRLLALLAAALVLLPSSAFAASVGETAVDLEDELMCLSCGRPLSSSGGTGAEDQRRMIRDLLEQGMTKQQVKEALVAEYGERVLVKDASPLAAAAPWAAGVVGLAAVALVLRRRRGGPGEPADAPLPAGPAPATTELSADDQARIDAELAGRETA